MKRRYFTSLSLVAIAITCLTWPAQTLAAGATLGFETQALDLDTGTITEQFSALLDGTEGADILIGYQNQHPNLLNLCHHQLKTLRMLD